MLANLEPIQASANEVIYKASLHSPIKEPIELSYIGFIGASHKHYRQLSGIQKAIYDFLDSENKYRKNVLFPIKKPYQLLIQQRNDWYDIQPLAVSETFQGSRLDHKYVLSNLPKVD